MANKTTKKSNKYILGEKIEDLIDADSVELYDRYIVMNDIAKYSDEKIEEEFLKVVNAGENSKNKYPNVVALAGVNLDHFYSKLCDIKLPKYYHLNFATIIADLDYLLEQNDTEVTKVQNQTAKYNINEVPDDKQKPTPFIEFATKLFCENLIKSKALDSIIEDNDSVGGTGGVGV